MKDKIKATLPHAAHLSPANELCHPSENNSNNNDGNYHDDDDDNDGENDNIYLRSMNRLTSG